MNKILKVINIWIRKSPFCHSIPERCFVFNNRCLPICARCTGILVGGFLFSIVLMFSDTFLNWQISFILALPMIVDGGLQYLTHYQSNNIRRFVTGFLCGIGAVIFSQNLKLINLISPYN